MLKKNNTTTMPPSRLSDTSSSSDEQAEEIFYGTASEIKAQKKLRRARKNRESAQRSRARKRARLAYLEEFTLDQRAEIDELRRRVQTAVAIAQRLQAQAAGFRRDAGKLGGGGGEGELGGVSGLSLGYRAGSSLRPSSSPTRFDSVVDASSGVLLSGDEVRGGGGEGEKYVSRISATLKRRCDEFPPLSLPPLARSNTLSRVNNGDDADSAATAGAKYAPPTPNTLFDVDAFPVPPTPPSPPASRAAGSEFKRKRNDSDSSSRFIADNNHNSNRNNNTRAKWFNTLSNNTHCDDSSSTTGSEGSGVAGGADLFDSLDFSSIFSSDEDGSSGSSSIGSDVDSGSLDFDDLGLGLGLGLGGC